MQTQLYIVQERDESGRHEDRLAVLTEHEAEAAVASKGRNWRYRRVEVAGLLAGLLDGLTATPATERDRRQSQVDGLMCPTCERGVMVHRGGERTRVDAHAEATEEESRGRGAQE